MTGPAAPPSRRPSRLRWLVASALGMVAAMAALLLVPPVGVDVGPAVLQFSARPEASWRAGTTADLGSLGRVGLDTHRGPVAVRLRMQEIHPDVMTAVVTAGRELAVPEFDAEALRSGAIRYGLAVALLAVAAGAGASGVVLRSRSAVAWGGAGGLVLVLGLGGLTLASFRTEPPESVTFEGALSVAPAVYGDVTVRYEDFVSQVGSLTTQFAALQQQVASELPAGGQGSGGPAAGQPGEEPDPIRMLVVSDLHLNEAGMAMAVRLAESYDVDLVVNLGDDTDWGSAAESDRVFGQPEFDVPYLWVRGNHDSRDTQDGVAAGGATVLDDDVASVAGLTVYGIGDPTFTPRNSRDVLDVGEQEYKRSWSEREFLPRYRRAAAASADLGGIDVVLVHDQTMARALLELARDSEDSEGGYGDVSVPRLVLSGHIHRFIEGEAGPVRLIEMGSTGGAGLRTFDSPEGSNPNQAGIVYLAADGSRILGYDLFTFQPLEENRFTMRREVFESPPEDPEEPERAGEAERDGQPGRARADQ